MKALDLLKIVFEIILFLMLLAAINIFLSGCSVLQPTEQITTNTGIITNTDVIYKTIKSTNWVLSFLLLGFVLGLIGSFGLGFKRIGLVTSGACIAGIFLSAAISNTWFYIGAGLVVFASVLIVIAGILMKNRAILDLIVGIEYVRDDLGNKGIAKEILKEHQRPQTQRIVQEVKTNLKLKKESRLYQRRYKGELDES